MQVISHFIDLLTFYRIGRLTGIDDHGTVYISMKGNTKFNVSLVTMVTDYILISVIQFIKMVWLC